MPGIPTLEHWNQKVEAYLKRSLLGLFNLTLLRLNDMLASIR
jgi:hypothetical protein